MSVGAFWDALRARKEKGRDLVERVTHLRLRGRLLAAWEAGGVEAVGRALVAWYRDTARGFDKPGFHVRHTGHPTIHARWQRIQALLDHPSPTVADIPAEFSLRVKQEGLGAPTPLLRRGHQHSRLAAGGVVAKVVGYRAGADGQPDRGRPIVLSVQPDWSVAADKRGGYRDLPAVPDDLAAPLVHDGTPFEPRRRQKQGAVEAWLRAAGCCERHWVRAGSTVRYADARREFVRNHKDPPPDRYLGIVAVAPGIPAA